jgi:hypothetical protein
VADCGLLERALEVLAPQFPATKFLRIVSTACIPDYPDRNLPTVLLYHNTKNLQTLVGLGPYGGRSITPERKRSCTLLPFSSSTCRDTSGMLLIVGRLSIFTSI